MAQMQFDEFFAAGKEESISPFLTPSSKRWGKHISLKAAGASACLLLLAFSFSFIHTPLSHFFLLFVYFLSGTPALLDALEDLKNLEVNIDVLMTFAALLSVVIGSQLEGALLLVLFEFSAALENMVTHKTKSALLALHQIAPRFACLLDDEGVSLKRRIQEVPIGARLLIKAGEIIPLDGIVLEGSSSVNLAHLTGEAHPLSKMRGDEVQAGSYNLDGTLTIRVTHSSADSTLSRIIALITEAQSAKPRLQRFLDRFGKTYALTIISLALFFALALPLFFSIPYLGIEGGIYRALAFLIAASPCALILATPTAYLSALSAAARQGILLKGGVILDALAQCRLIAFDKTGTLTTGKLACIEIESISPGSLSHDEALAIAFSLERHAHHPIADALTSLALKQELKPLELLDFKAIPGSGLQATIVQKEKAIPVFIGDEAFILPKLPSSVQDIWRAKKDRGTLHALLLVGEMLFLFHFVDEVRPESCAVIGWLKQEGFCPIMLTGDRRQSAERVAEKVGITEVHAHLKPEDKLQKVAILAEQGLVMVGDGVNDAPALARATVGISLGKVGSATAVDASDIVLLKDDLSLLPSLLHKAHKTLRIVTQNLVLALCVIVLASLPALFGLVPLWIAVILHEGGSVLVGLNSLRLLKLDSQKITS